MNTKYKLGSASQENQVNNKQKKIRVINLP